MKRELPVYVIEGTAFVVDVANLQLREKENPGNVLYVFEMWDVGDGYAFDYSPKIKNMPALPSNDENETFIKIPPLKKLDLVGMAEAYGYSPEEIMEKSDFGIMVDQEALTKRLMGHLPVVDIAGDSFYVDLKKDRMFPEGSFLSKGIVFSEIRSYYNNEQSAYIIPYNPKTREFEAMDYDNITAIPKDQVLVAFEHESILDPVGYNSVHGWDELCRLKFTNVKSHFKAKVIKWEDTAINLVIEKNLNKWQQEMQEKKDNVAGKRRHRYPKL